MAAAYPNLTGKILAAHPTLRDGNFRRTLIYIVSHDEETGTLGFIVNRPAHPAFTELEAGALPADFHPTKIYLGGPVSPQNVILASFEWDPIEGRTTLQHFTDDTLSPDIDPERTIALLGYAGWSEGQLERELSENAWIILEPNCDLLHADAATWKRLVVEIHPNLRLLAELPDDPSLN